MKREMFEKVYIKSEEDLPKKKSYYIFGWDKTNININNGISELIFDPQDDESIHEYIEDYDWYLRPVSYGRYMFEKVTNEAINKLAKAYAKDHSEAPDKDCPDWIIHDYEAGAYAVRELLTGFLNLTDEGVKKIPVSYGRDIDWQKVHDDFIAWDTEGKFEFSQRQIFEWFKKRLATELSEVRESVTDEDIIDASDDYGQRHQEDAFGYSIYGITSNAFTQGAKWLRSRLQPAQSPISDEQIEQDIDLAYCTGVFNVGGIDALSKEIERLKNIGKKPHDIFTDNRGKIAEWVKQQE